MNVKPSRANQPLVQSQKTPAPPSGAPSDGKEILFLASGLITLLLGIGGALMYSEEPEPTVTAASEESSSASIPLATAFASSSSTPASFPSKPVSDDVILTASSLPGPSADPTAQETVQLAPTDVYFDFNRWALTDAAKFLIKTQVKTLPDGWDGTLTIQGHTDAQGPDSYNKVLGLKRAQAVKTYVVSLGIAEDTVQVETMGKDGAICLEETHTCFEQNRRAHLAFFPSTLIQDKDEELAQIPSIQHASLDSEALSVSQDLTSPDSSEEASLPDVPSAEFISADPLMTAESQP